jgi:sulfane dehydrogenase subunit SoxC
MGDEAFVHYDERARRTADAMIAAEARHIAQRQAQDRAQDEECACKKGMFPRAGLTDRRAFLFAAGSLAGTMTTAAVAQPAKAPPGAIHFDVPADPTKAATARARNSSRRCAGAIPPPTNSPHGA